MNDTRNITRPSRCALVLGFILILSIILLSGCAQQPNSNLSASACCPAKPAPYGCHIVTQADGVTPQTDGNGNTVLDGCGNSCLALQKGTGIPLDGTGAAHSISDCADNCNFKAADCSNGKGDNTCYSTDGKNTPIAPICANAAPDPCVQNDCTAMVCGKPRATVKLGLDSGGIQAAAVPVASGDNSFSAQAKDSKQDGLVGRICQFRALDASTTRLLKSADWFVNTLRLGVGGTFSDYDRARFYMPITDYFCPNTNPNAVVDRYTNYLDGQKPLSEFSGNAFHAPLTSCRLDKASTYYYCYNTGSAIDPATDPANPHYALGPTSSTRAAAFTACNQACNAFRLKTCAQNPDLLLLQATISPPGGSLVKQPYVDANQYLQSLQAAYPNGGNPSCAPGDTAPGCDPRDYYKSNPPSDCATNGPNCQAYMATQGNLPGPAGAKVFECVTSGDCLSGVCDKSSYSRSSCFKKDGTPTALSCACHVVSDCERFFNCAQYPDGSIPKAVCGDNIEACQRQLPKDSNGGTAIVCDYDIDVPHGLLPAVAGVCKLEDTNSKDDGKWGVLDLSEFNRDLHKYPGYSNIEMATTQKPVTLQAPATLPAWQDEPNACFSYHMEGGGLLSGPAHPVPDLRWAWGSSFWAVPNEQTVAGPSSQRFIETSPSVTWQNANCALSLSGLDGNGQACPNPKFPLIPACNMKNPTDIELVDANNVASADFYIGHSPDRRVNQTWVIHSFGDCQVDSSQMPVVQSYGVCKPCGTMLTLAYQNVTHWNAPSNPLVWGDPTSSPAGYCPAGCSTSWYVFGGSQASSPGPATSTQLCVACPNAYPSTTVSPMSEGSPDTYPEYGLLVNKIDEYQSAGVMPVLDLRSYDLPMPQVRTLSGLTKEQCLGAGGTLGDSSCTDPGGNGICVNPTWGCTFPAVNDWLLSFLAKNHSAAVVVASNLPDDCNAAASSGANSNGDGPHCIAAKAKLQTVRTACPECMTGLEWALPLLPPVLDGAGDLAFKGSALEQALYKYDTGSGHRSVYLPDSFQSPWAVTSQGTSPPPADVSNVSALVLDIDLSTLSIPAGCTEPTSAACLPLDEQLNLTINYSRHVLQSIGWPTIWKLTYPSPKSGAYNSQVLYEAIYNRQRELSLAGVIGVLLPPLDEQQIDSSGNVIVPLTNDGLLLPPGTTVKDTATPFCAAQGAASQYLHPQLLSGIQREDAQPVCGCVPCSDIDKAAGQCPASAATCDDGTICSVLDSSGKPIAGANTANYKCTPHCVSQSYCAANMCNAATTSTTCTAVLSSNKPPTPCCTASLGQSCTQASDCGAGQACDATSHCVASGCQNRPDCDLVASLPLKSLDPVDPQTPEFIAGLPAGSECCLASGADVFTYRSTSSIGTNAEPAIFPGYGSNTSDCGRQPNLDADHQAAVCAGTAPAPIPISNKLWVCTPPQ